MTKTLTENKWFYTENGIKDASWNLVFKSEVLAAVPSYDHFSQLVKKVERLQEQLNEANEVLEEYASITGIPVSVAKQEIKKLNNKWGVK